MWQNEKMFSKDFFAWLISRFLLKVTSNVDEIKSNYQKNVWKKFGEMRTTQRKLKNVKSSFWLYIDFICIVFVHSLASKSRWLKIV